jgi:hypothetical protein
VHNPVAVQFDRATLSWKIARLGGVMRSLLMFVCGAVLLGGAAIVLEPQALVAVHQPQPLDRSQQRRDEFSENLAALLSNCLEVLACNNHSPNAQASVVLWASDDENPGVVDPKEIKVISHSPLLRTITVYTLESKPGQSEAPARVQPGKVSGMATGSPRHPLALRLTGPLDRTAVSAPVFCDRWRSTPSVEPRTFATGISDMRIDAIGTKDGDALSLLRLTLRWSADSADGPGEATALISPHKE